MLLGKFWAMRIGGAPLIASTHQLLSRTKRVIHKCVEPVRLAVAEPLPMWPWPIG
jgi:hypothetical protein